MEDLEIGPVKVSLQGWYGLLDYSGKEIQPCQLEMVACHINFSPETHELFYLKGILAMKKGLWGCIELKGNVVCDFIFQKLVYLNGEFDAKL